MLRLLEENLPCQVGQNCEYRGAMVSFVSAIVMGTILVLPRTKIDSQVKMVGVTRFILERIFCNEGVLSRELEIQV